MENDELQSLCSKDQWQTLFGNVTMGNMIKYTIIIH